MTKTRILPLFGEGGGGAQGIQGATGAQGIQGFIGFQGIAGESGIQGIQGFIGFQGIAGSDGVGIQGLQGFAGTDGSNGLQGADGAQGIQGIAGTDAVGIQGIQGFAGTDGTNGIQGIQGAAGSEPTKIELLSLPMETLVEFYQATIAGTMKDFSQYTANGYPLINAYKMNAGWTIADANGTGNDYTTDGTEVALLLNHTFHATGVEEHEDSKYIDEWITLFSPTIVTTYGEPISTTFTLGTASGIQGIQGVAGSDGVGIQGIQGSMGGSRSVWYGLQSQYENLPSYDPDTDYYISDLYYSEIENTPDLSVYALKSELVPGIQGLQGIQGLTGPQVSTNTITAVVTFTDQTTATYNIYVQ